MGNLAQARALKRAAKVLAKTLPCDPKSRPAREGVLCWLLLVGPESGAFGLSTLTNPPFSYS